MWGVRGRALSPYRLPALWAGCRGPLATGCGCGGVRAWGHKTGESARRTRRREAKKNTEHREPGTANTNERQGPGHPRPENTEAGDKGGADERRKRGRTKITSARQRGTATTAREGGGGATTRERPTARQHKESESARRAKKREASKKNNAKRQGPGHPGPETKKGKRQRGRKAKKNERRKKRKKKTKKTKARGGR